MCIPATCHISQEFSNRATDTPMLFTLKAVFACQQGPVDLNYTGLQGNEYITCRQGLQLDVSNQGATACCIGLHYANSQSSLASCAEGCVADT